MSQGQMECLGTYTSRPISCNEKLEQPPLNAIRLGLQFASPYLSQDTPHHLTQTGMPVHRDTLPSKRTIAPARQGLGDWAMQMSEPLQEYTKADSPWYQSR